MAKIIIVTGTPGVGKTALARLLAKKTKAHFVNLGDFIKKERLYRRFDHATRSYVLDERRAYKKLKDYLAAHKRGRLVVETHHLTGIVPKRGEMVAIVLRLDPLVLARRLRERKWPKQKIWDNVEAEMIDVSLYESVMLLGVKKVYELDTTRKSPRKLAREALRVISAGKGWSRRTPNWLEKYDPIELSRKIL